MKFLGFLAAGLPVGVLSSSASVGFKESLLAESREHSVSFNALPFDLPSTTLLSDKMAAHDLKNRESYADVLGSDDRIMCTESGSIENKGEVAVVLAFSKCLNDSALGVVEQWVNQVKATITNIAQVTFQSTMVPGACEERSEKTKQGLEDPNMVNQGGTSLLADEVHPDDLKRLEAFPSLGHVVSLADDDVPLSLNPIAVISFVTGEKSYGEVYQFEQKAHISKTFNFHICKNGVNCDGTFENCIDLPEVVDLFMYNPFTVTRSLECSNLDGGVPVTYLDDYGQRQCFCNCPAGYQLDENEYGGLACVQVVEEPCSCVWAQMNEFPFIVTNDLEECFFSNMASNHGLPVPFPTDGYVADKRDNFDGAVNPRIIVTAAREQDAEYKGRDIRGAVGSGTSYPLTFQEVVGLYPRASSFTPVVNAGYSSSTHNEVITWKEYQTHRDSHIDDISFTSYGKYHLEVSAYDYFSSATCEGCLVIVDHNRPKATTDCPNSFCDTVVDPVQCTGTAELTEENLDKANDLAEKYFDFSELASNDACSIDNRCDDESFSRRDFFETDYSICAYSQAPKCFDKATVVNDLLSAGKTKTNPLVNTDDNCDNTLAPVPPGQCTRCCKMETVLKEWWTDYRCGSDYDVRSCDGDSSQTCAFQQCLVVNGDTLATVTAAITADAKAESESVLAQVEDQAYQTVTQIHRSLDCTSFNETCVFNAKLSELIDTTETLNLASMDSGEATEYVYWRYSIVSGDASWELWKTKRNENYGEVTYDNDDVLTFSNPETKITIEAWTQCGLVRRFFFYVHLHVNSPMSVCEKFNDMWYQTSVSRLPIGTGMCAYPGSDFAELTFDFHPNAGLQYSREELKMKVSKVQCTGKLENRKPIDILTVTQDSPEIVTRFAVEMLNKATTEAATDFEVTCAFTYTMYSGKLMTETCTRDFSIRDCEGPGFGPPDSICQYEDCAGVDEAGLYEACGGTVIKADETCTIVETSEKPCCQGCGDTDVTCTALLDLPGDNTDLMRCEPSLEDAYSTEYSYHQVAVLLGEATQAHPAAVALLSTTAVVAAVALLVVRRRVIATHSAQTIDDAYYPLLH